MGSENEIMISMKVTGLTIDPFTNMPIVILKDQEEKTALPIWIGLIEASSIASELENVQLSRPMTHDLIKNLLQELDAKILRVEINDLHDNTFYAKIYIKSGERHIVLDARPSDAIAIALRVALPIHVSPEVVEKSRRIDLTETVDSDESKRQKWTEVLENLSPEDFGKYKM